MTSFNRKQKLASKFHIKYLCHIALLISIFLSEVSGQFFTKSSSKSIPRMGRRSIQQSDAGTPNGRLESTNHGSLVDALISEFGPNLLTKLEEAKREAETGRNNLLIDNAETKLENQSISMTRNDLTNEQPIGSDNSLYNSYDRNERSSLASIKSQPSFRDANLAMRAFNTDRYLKHLASGQPLTPFENLLINSRDRFKNSGSELKGIKQAGEYQFD